MTKEILITGVAGFIGSKVAQRFLDKGFVVYGVDDLSSGNKANIPANIEFIEGDLALDKTIQKLPKKCNKLLHLAGQSSGEISFDNPVSDLEKNTISTLNLIKYSIATNIERILYASSMSVYGNVRDKPIKESFDCYPLSCYGSSKLASENYLRIFKEKLPYVSLRMFNVYGPGQDMTNLRQGMVSIFVAQALSKNRIEVKGSLERFRDFIYIDDVVDVWFDAAFNQDALNQTINVGTGLKTTVKDLLEQICKIIPNCSFFQSDPTPGDQKGIYPDVGLMKSLFNIEAFTQLHEGLKNFIEYEEDKHLKENK